MYMHISILEYKTLLIIGLLPITILFQMYHCNYHRFTVYDQLSSHFLPHPITVRTCVSTRVTEARITDSQCNTIRMTFINSES